MADLFGSWRATSAVIRSNPGDLRRGNELILCFTSPREKDLFKHAF